MADTDTCPTCGARGVDGLHRTRCAHREQLGADVVGHAARVGISEPKAAVLWAHLQDIYAEGEQAARAARAVIDLGWRP